MGPQPKAEIDRFLGLCEPEPNSGCWLWLGRKLPHGYGGFRIGSMVDGTRRMELAHRVSHRLFKGAASKYVLHHCDTPSCVNPEHLFLGSQADNIQDMKLKGRGFWQKGAV